MRTLSDRIAAPGLERLRELDVPVTAAAIEVERRAVVVQAQLGRQVADDG